MLTTSMMGRLLSYITLAMVSHATSMTAVVCMSILVMEVIYQQEGDLEPDTRF